MLHRIVQSDLTKFNQNSTREIPVQMELSNTSQYAHKHKTKE